MADRVRYINPLSSGGDGTTTALSGSAAAYASLSAAISGETADLDTAGDTLRLQCFGIAEDTVPIVMPGGYVSSVTNPIIIENATGESGGDPSLEDWDINAYRFNPVSSDANGVINFGINDVRNLDWIEFRGIQIGAVLNGGVTQAGIKHTASPSNGTILLDNCVLRLSGTCTGSSANFANPDASPSTFLIRNCLGLKQSFSGSAVSRLALTFGATSEIVAHNNTVVGFDEAFTESGSSSLTLSNNLFSGNVIDTAGVIDSGGGNVTDNANFGSMTSTGNHAARSFDFSPSSYQLSGDDAGAAQQGVDLSSDPVLPVTTDAFGTARPEFGTYDAGYHEKGAVTREASPQVGSAVPGAAITFDLTNFSSAPTSATINGVAASISNASTSNVDITLPLLSAFVLSGAHQATPWLTDITVEITEPAGVAATSIQIDAPSGADQYSGLVTTVAGDSIFPVAAATNDVYFTERLTGTGFEVLDTGSTLADSPDWSAASRIFDFSAGLWSAAEVVSLVFSDTTPDAFVFTDQTNAALSSVISSNAITVAGIDSPAPITITNGEYSINGGAFTAASGVVNLNDDVVVRVTTSASYLTVTSATLTIGTVQDVFSVTTLATDSTPDSFAFIDQASALFNNIIQSNPIAVSGINSPAAISISSAQIALYSINAGSPVTSPGTVVNGDQVTVYLLSANVALTETQATLTIGGVSDVFSVTTGPDSGFSLDLVPNQFDLGADVVDAKAGQSFVRSFTLSGVTAGQDVQVSGFGGATVSKNGGVYSAIIQGRLGDIIRVKAIAGSIGQTLVVGATSNGIMDSFSVTTTSNSIQPKGFDVGGAIINAKFSTVIKADLITVEEAPEATDLAITVTNGTYSIDGGAETSAPGIIQNGQTAQLRVTSSSSPYTPVVGNLDIEGKDSDFIVVTGKS